jgi:hypothetical protein
MGTELSVMRNAWSAVSSLWSVVRGLWSVLSSPLPHAGEFGVADKVTLQLGIERALAAQPGKGPFGLLAQRDLRKLRFAALARRGAFDFDFDQLSARPYPGIHAARGDQLGLGVGIGGKEAQDGGEVRVGEFMSLAAEQPADVAFGEAAAAGDGALIEPMALGLALESDAEIAHGLVDSRRWGVDSGIGIGRISFFCSAGSILRNLLLLATGKVVADAGISEQTDPSPSPLLFGMGEGD